MMSEASGKSGQCRIYYHGTACLTSLTERLAMNADQEALHQEFLALPKDQWTAKAYRLVGDYMKQAGKTDKEPEKVWEGPLAPLKGVLLELGRQDIFLDVSDWLLRTSKPYWDDRKRVERAAKASSKKAASQPVSEPA